MRLTRWLACTSMLLAVAAPAAAEGHPFREGEPFPLLALPELRQGRAASVADFRGRKLMLHVFASW